MSGGTRPALSGADDHGMRRWAVVIPVRGGDGSKTRLDTASRSALARAFARDTVSAALRCDRVAEVIVVTAEGFAAGPARGLRVVLDRGTGLSSAIGIGLGAVADPTLHRAILLGDLPALRPHDLAEVLARAARVPRGFVADADGTGTTLTTARAGTAHRIRFGRGSAELHRKAGYRALSIRAGSTLRHDVDHVSDLRRAQELRIGTATAAVLAGAVSAG